MPSISPKCTRIRPNSVVSHSAFNLQLFHIISSYLSCCYLKKRATVLKLLHRSHEGKWLGRIVNASWSCSYKVYFGVSLFPFRREEGVITSRKRSLLNISIQPNREPNGGGMLLVLVCGITLANSKWGLLKATTPQKWNIGLRNTWLRELRSSLKYTKQEQTIIKSRS